MLGILYDHPGWMEPLFATLAQRKIPFQPLRVQDLQWEVGEKPAFSVLLNRVSQSSSTREREHPIYFVQAYLAHLARAGVRVINGSHAFTIDSSKANQLSLLRSVGAAVPRTKVVHRAEHVAAAARDLRFPILVKANVGGAGAGIVGFASHDQITTEALPQSVDQVLLVQEQAVVEKITRMEFLDRKFLYAIDVETAPGLFDLCPADVCNIDRGGRALSVTKATPSPEVIALGEAVMRAAEIDAGGVEYLERQGEALFFDINAMSNYVANASAIIGFDPFASLADYLERA